MRFGDGVGAIEAWWAWLGPRDDAAETEADVAEDERWVVAYTTGFDDEAILIKGFLAQAEIECIIEDAKFHAEPVNIGDMAQIRLLVREDQADEAQRLIAEAQATPVSETEDDA